MNTYSSLSSIDTGAISQDEQALNDAYVDNQNNPDVMSFSNMRDAQLLVSNLQVRSLLDSNFISCKAGICKSIIRNIVP